MRTSTSRSPRTAPDLGPLLVLAARNREKARKSSPGAVDQVESHPVPSPVSRSVDIVHLPRGARVCEKYPPPLRVVSNSSVQDALSTLLIADYDARGPDARGEPHAHHGCRSSSKIADESSVRPERPAAATGSGATTGSGGDGAQAGTPGTGGSGEAGAGSAATGGARPAKPARAARPARLATQARAAKLQSVAAAESAALRSGAPPLL